MSNNEEPEQRGCLGVFFTSLVFPQLLVMFVGAAVIGIGLSVRGPMMYLSMALVLVIATVLWRKFGFFKLTKEKPRVVVEIFLATAIIAIGVYIHLGYPEVGNFHLFQKNDADTRPEFQIVDDQSFSDEEQSFQEELNSAWEELLEETATDGVEGLQGQSLMADLDLDLLQHAPAPIPKVDSEGLKEVLVKIDEELGKTSTDDH